MVRAFGALGLVWMMVRSMVAVLAVVTRAFMASLVLSTGGLSRWLAIGCAGHVPTNVTANVAAR